MALPDSLGKLLLELLAARGAFANAARSPCYMQANIPRLWTGLWWVKPIFVVPLGWGGAHTGTNYEDLDGLGNKNKFRTDL